MAGAEVLRNLPLFADLSLPELRLVHDLSKTETIAANTSLIVEGLPASALFVLLEGTVEGVDRSDQVRARFKLGESVGDLGLVDGGGANLTVVSRTSVRLLRLDYHPLRMLLDQHPLLANRVFRVLLKQLAQRLRAMS